MQCFSLRHAGVGALVVAVASAIALGGGPCENADHDCNVPGGPGCTDGACCETVCSCDPYCCETEWDAFCVGPNGTVLGCSWLELCQEPVGECVPDASGSCGEPHMGLGCKDAACCALVCSQNPLCCELWWDEDCVNEAVLLCGLFFYECTPGGPANDCAPNATVVSDGSVVNFNTITANTDGPMQPECNSAESDLQIWKDVWYRFTAPANGIAVASTCGTATFDTKIAAYDVGDWSSFDPSLLPSLFMLCNEDGPGECTNFTSILEFPVTVGRTYLVRMGGYQGENGTGSISFTMPEPCQLPDATVTEDEDCGADTNGGCNNPKGSVQTIQVGDSVAGTFWADGGTRDTDWYEFTLAATSNVAWSVYSASLTNTFIINAACGDALVVYGTGSGECPRVASACLQPGTYRVFVSLTGFEGTPCNAGDFNNYVGVLTAEPAECPSGGDVCENPGPDTVTQNSSQDLLVGGVGCAAGGITVANNYARSFSGLTSGEIRCVNFGWTNSGSAIPATLGIYRDTNGGEPLGVGIDLELLAEREFILPNATNVMVTAQFAEPICLDGNTSPIVVVLSIEASTDGFASFSGNGLAETGSTYIQSDGCAIGNFVTVGSIGFDQLRWVVAINGNFAECGGDPTPPCPADFNGDGQVNGADLGTLLGDWGPCSGCASDLNGDGQVNGADLGTLLGDWGACPQ